MEAHDISYEDLSDVIALFDKKAAEKYMVNAAHDSRKRQQMFHEKTTSKGVDGSFVWADTSEGHEYWREIDLKVWHYLNARDAI